MNELFECNQSAYAGTSAQFAGMGKSAGAGTSLAARKAQGRIRRPCFRVFTGWEKKDGREARRGHDS